MTTHSHDVHVCLVSQQATPNLVPLLDPDFAPKRVILVVSPDMQSRAQWLAGIIRPRGIHVETFPINDAWDIRSLQDEFLDLLAPCSDDDLALNVTGGTKPMAMAAQQVFVTNGRPVFYLHERTGEILWLSPRHANTALSNNLKLKDYLHAHGWEVRSPGGSRLEGGRLDALTSELIRDVGHLQYGLGLLNLYAQRCGDKRVLKQTLEPGHQDHAGLDAVAERFAAAGLVEKWGTSIEFKNENARFYCNGGWLEEHVFSIARGLTRDPVGGLRIQDATMSVKVRSLDNTLKTDAGSNELDVCILANNRLHIVECKTRSFNEKESSAPAMYKLDALTALGGLKTRGMLVTYRPLNDGDRQRAHDLRIEVIQGDGLQNLRSRMAEWLR